MNSYPFLFYKESCNKFLNPKAQASVAWNFYILKKYEKSLKLLNSFNFWQPNEEGLLLEGYCFQNLGNFDEAEKIYRKVFEFNPFYKKAYLAYIDLKLKKIEISNSLNEKTIDEIISKIPWEDEFAKDKISLKLLNISKNLSKREKLIVFSSIFYICPSKDILKKTSFYLIKEKSFPLYLRKIGLHIFLSASFYEKNGLEKNELIYLEKFMENWEREKNLVIQNKFKWLKYEEIKEIINFEEIGSSFYPLCLEEKWLKSLGYILRSWLE